MNRWKIQSTFQKMALSFLVLGVLPLLCVCLLFLRRYEANAQVTIESNMVEADYYAETKVGDLISTIDNAMERLYNYSGGGYAALYDILESDALSENERSMYVGLMLDEFLQASPAVSAAYFITAQGACYNRFYSQQKTLRVPIPGHYTLPETDSSRFRQLFILPATSEAEWCNNSTDTVLTLARNYMDTRSLNAVTTVSLGTLYIDIQTEKLNELLASIRLGENGNAAVVDGATREIVYRLKDDKAMALPPEIDYQGGRYDSEFYSLFYAPIGESAYQLVVSFDRQELYSTYTANRTFLFLLLAAAAVLVLVLGLNFSGQLSKPARKLQRAMQEVQQGNLNVRVDIQSGDEMEELGSGFNTMVEELGETIQDVYMAEICRQNAELNALKMQVQPHYLYNTLDIIRMNALESGDEKTARLIESLSHQLRYVMGSHSERVKLKQELDSLREYAVLVEARYEGRIHVSIEAENGDLGLLVPKLLLQPFVENAIKHGLRDKPEGGIVLVEVTRLADMLQIVVLNDGTSIDPQRLAHIRSFLATAEIGEQDSLGVVSVGMKNTYDRIKINCGKEYGFSMDSDGNMGVIVTIHLPIWREGEEHVEDTAG